MGSKRTEEALLHNGWMKIKRAGVFFCCWALFVCTSVSGSGARSPAVHRTTDDVGKLLESLQEPPGSNLEQVQRWRKQDYEEGTCELTELLNKWQVMSFHCLIFPSALRM